MYFLIYCLSFTHYFSCDIDQKYKFLFLILSVIMTSMHVFGLVISMSMLTIYGFLSLKINSIKLFFCNVISAVILFLLFAVMFYYSTLEVANFRALSWIEFQKWYFRVFLEWSSPIGILVVLF